MRENEASGPPAYESPLATRYATAKMIENFGDLRRARLWRQLWIALAEAQRELGLPIIERQIEALRAHQDDVDFASVAAHEAKLRHDVMAHVRAWGEQVGPEAEKIIHVGATSCYVTDNAELVMIRDGLELLMDRLFTVLEQLRDFAMQQRSEATLAYTHFQPAQLTTVGKRACLWLADLAEDMQTLASVQARLRLRGAKGTTGTQASFLSLFDGDHGKVRALDRRIAEKMGFSSVAAVTGQTYSRKYDGWVLSALSDVCASAAKLASDLRLLAHEREVDEPFEDTQVGSSAMAYKRNPMRSERICSLARFVFSLSTSPHQTHAQQWLERTLDDSANRRLVITEAFLATDAVLNLLADVSAGLRVHPAVIRANMADELAFMATENVIMNGVRAGESRQRLHEKIREHSLAAVRRMKEDGASNDLLERMRKDPELAAFVSAEAIDPARYVGRAPQQVDEFVAEVLEPLIVTHAHRRGRFAPRVRV
jgi:adenylosuccinate lyase